MQLGIYSFGALATDPDTGSPVDIAQAGRNLVERSCGQIRWGWTTSASGMHHTEVAPASASATLLAGAATRTSRIRLASAATVLGTDDPVRVFQQFGTVDALSDGRADTTAGRGCSSESFPQFGYLLRDHDVLSAEEVGLLMQLDRSQRVAWSGTTRKPLEDAVVVPRPHAGRLPMWLGTGGNPGSSVRAGQLGLPAAYRIIGESPARFAPVVDSYRQAFHAGGAPLQQGKTMSTRAVELRSTPLRQDGRSC